MPDSHLLNAAALGRALTRIAHEIVERNESGADVVLVGDLPEKLRQDAEMYAGCVAGAIPKEDYLGLIRETGFDNIMVQKEKPIHLPDDILSNYLNPDELESYRKGDSGIFSITVYAEKKTSCCAPGCC